MFIDGFRSLDCSALCCYYFGVAVAFAAVVSVAAAATASDCNTLRVCVCVLERVSAVCTAILLMLYVFVYTYVVNTAGIQHNHTLHLTPLYSMLLFNFFAICFCSVARFIFSLCLALALAFAFSLTHTFDVSWLVGVVLRILLLHAVLMFPTRTLSTHYE